MQPQVPLELVLHRELLGAVAALEVADAVGVRAQVPLLGYGCHGSICIGSLFPTFSYVANLHSLMKAFLSVSTKWNCAKQMQFILPCR